MPMRPCPKCGDIQPDGMCPKHPRSSARYRPGRQRTDSDPNWARTQRAIVRRDGALCRYCGHQGGSADHVLPRSRGGRSVPSNLVCACGACNSSKGDRTVREWILSGTAPAGARAMLDVGDREQS